MQGRGGKITGFSSRGVAYPKVLMDDGRAGVTSRRVLHIGGDWPYVAKQAWNPPAQNKNELTVRRNDTGKIIAYDESLQWAQVTDPDPQKPSGWLPSQLIAVGTERKFGDFAVVNKNALGALQANVQPSRPSGRWAKTKVAQVIKALLTDIAVNEAILTELKSEIKTDIGSEAARDAFTNTVVEGLNLAGILDLLENKHDLTIDDVLNTCDRTRGSDACGIYLRFYAKFRSIAAWRDTSKIYTGSAANFRSREDHYTSAFNTDNPQSKGQHGMASNDAGIKHAVIACLLPEASGHSLLLAETVLLLLFGTYDSLRVRGTQGVGAVVSAASNADASSKQAGVHLSTAVTEAEIQEIEQDLQGADPAFRSMAKDDKRAAWGQMKAQAAQMLHLASATFKKVGWVPLRERRSFSASYGTMHGLNIQTPVCASWLRPIFIKSLAPNRVIYRRTALTCVKRGQGVGLGFFGTTGHVIWFSTSPQTAPALGTKIYLVFEITADGSRHPRSWARLPTVCRFADAGEAGTLAVQAQYYDDKKQTWMSKYLQSAHVPRRFNDQTPGGIGAIGDAMGILNSLKGRSFTIKHSRAFDTIFAPCRVIEISFDSLRQVKTIEEKKQVTAYIKPGDRLSDDAIRRQLEAAGATRVNGTFGQLPSGGTRNNCDRCRLSSVGQSKCAVGFNGEGGTKTCVRIPGTNQCKMCALYDLPCSWTREVEKTPKLIQALWFPPGHPGAALVMENFEFERDVHDASSSSASRRLVWQKPAVRLSIEESQSYSDANAYSGNIPEGVWHSEWLRTSSRSLVRDIVRPMLASWQDARRADRTEEATQRLSKVMGLLFELNAVFRLVPSQNLIDAADYIIQSIDATMGRDSGLWDDARIIGA